MQVMMPGMGMGGMGMGMGYTPMANPYAAFGSASPAFNAGLGMGAPGMQLQRGLRGLDPGMSYNPFTVSTAHQTCSAAFLPCFLP